MGILAAFTVVVMLVVGIYLFGYATKFATLFQVLFLETLIGVILILPLLLFFDHLTLTQIFIIPKIDNWYWLAAAAFLGYVGGNYFSLKSLKEIGEQANSLLSPAITVTTLFFCYFIFDEKVMWYQWLGIITVLSAVFYFLINKNGIKDFSNFKKGFFSSALCIVCISLTIICSIKGTDERISLLHAIFIRLFIALILITIINFIFKKEKLLQKQHKKFYVIIIAAVICQTIVANYLWFYATFKLGVAHFQLILSTLPLFIYFTDVILFKKKLHMQLFLIVALITALGICLSIL